MLRNTSECPVVIKPVRRKAVYHHPVKGIPEKADLFIISFRDNNLLWFKAAYLIFQGLYIRKLRDKEFTGS